MSHRITLWGAAVLFAFLLGFFAFTNAQGTADSKAPQLPPKTFVKGACELVDGKGKSYQLVGVRKVISEGGNNKPVGRAEVALQEGMSRFHTCYPDKCCRLQEECVVTWIPKAGEAGQSCVRKGATINIAQYEKRKEETLTDYLDNQIQRYQSYVGPQEPKDVNKALNSLNTESDSLQKAFAKDNVDGDFANQLKDRANVRVQNELENLAAFEEPESQLYTQYEIKRLQGVGGSLAKRLEAVPPEGGFAETSLPEKGPSSPALTAPVTGLQNDGAGSPDNPVRSQSIWTKLREGLSGLFPTEENPAEKDIQAKRYTDIPKSQSNTNPPTTEVCNGEACIAYVPPTLPPQAPILGKPVEFPEGSLVLAQKPPVKQLSVEPEGLPPPDETTASKSKCVEAYGKKVTTKNGQSATRTCEEEGTVFSVRTAYDLDTKGKRGPVYTEVVISECNAVLGRTGAGHCLAIYKDSQGNVRRMLIPLDKDSGEESDARTGENTGRSSSIAQIASEVQSTGLKKAMQEWRSDPNQGLYTPEALNQIADAFETRAREWTSPRTPPDLQHETLERLEALSKTPGLEGDQARQALEDIRSAQEIRRGLAEQERKLEASPGQPTEADKALEPAKDEQKPQPAVPSSQTEERPTALEELRKRNDTQEAKFRAALESAPSKNEVGQLYKDRAEDLYRKWRDSESARDSPWRPTIENWNESFNKRFGFDLKRVPTQEEAQAEVSENELRFKQLMEEWRSEYQERGGGIGAPWMFARDRREEGLCEYNPSWCERVNGAGLNGRMNLGASGDSDVTGDTPQRVTSDPIGAVQALEQERLELLTLPPDEARNAQIKLLDRDIAESYKALVTESNRKWELSQNGESWTGLVDKLWYRFQYGEWPTSDTTEANAREMEQAMDAWRLSGIGCPQCTARQLTGLCEYDSEWCQPVGHLPEWDRLRLEKSRDEERKYFRELEQALQNLCRQKPDAAWCR